MSGSMSGGGKRSHGSDTEALATERASNRLCRTYSHRARRRLYPNVVVWHLMGGGDLLRHKQLYFRCGLEVSVASTTKLLPAVIERFRAMTHFLEFLDMPLAR